MGSQLLGVFLWQHGWMLPVFGAIAAAIVALYFLRLKRRPVEVPSTYLWHKSIEDLHVNTIWQRLKRNLLLFLQLLMILLAILAVLQPGCSGTELPGDRFIFLIDNSASMQATDGERSRLEEAKVQARDLIDQLEPGDVGMILSFAETARVEQMFTSNRRELRRSLEAIRPTSRPTSLVDALKVASGLANPDAGVFETTLDPDAPASTMGGGSDQMAEARPATLLLVSDGKFAPVSGFSLGNLHPIFIPIGSAEASNVGIVAFSVGRNEMKPTQLEAFARLKNFGPEELEVTVELWWENQATGTAEQMIDADQFTIDSAEVHGVVFQLGEVDTGILSLRATTGDDLAVDDEAWAVINPPRPGKVLFLTPVTGSPRGEPLELALMTESAAKLTELTVESPEFLEKDEYRQQVDLGAYDLVIYNRCSPKEMPPSNTLFIGRLPPLEAWTADPAVVAPQIIDVDPAHPLTQWMDLSNVLLAAGTPLKVPPGGSVLIDSHVGPMFAIAPREGFEDAVLGFAFIEDEIGPDGQVQSFIGTDWPRRASFPVFVFNLLQYLGGGRIDLATESVRPGQPVGLESAAPGQRLEVRTPSGQTVTLRETKPGKFNFTATTDLGIYEVRAAGKTLEHFAVNLLHASESDIPTVEQVELGPEPVAGQTAGWHSVRREFWKLLLLLGLGVLCLEWYVFKRRVYL